MWLWWVLGGLLAWTVLAFLVAVVVGRSIRLAERREIEQSDLLPVPALPVAARPPVAAPRVRSPLPPLGMGLAAAAVALEPVGFPLRQGGDETRLFSMDAPYSLPR